MNELLQYTTDKKIDETIQGKPFDKALQSANYNTNKHFYIESYGCAMNFSDSEIVASILCENGYNVTTNFLEADLILINTCSIREKAELTIRNRLRDFNQIKKQKPNAIIGVLGCMAERLKSKFIEEEKLVDVVVGPDAYRSLPELINDAEGGNKAVNVILSREETYADITPVRLDKNGISAYISIMRGCDNMCSFCVVPFTRGRERSRNPESIINEIKEITEKGYKEIILLGQNVDSYKWTGENTEKNAPILVSFAQLLETVALQFPKTRIRFSTSHPKDISDDVIYTIAKHKNICNHIHLPVQSGSTTCLERMNRTYTREWYLERIQKIKEVIPNCGITSDMIAGFCGETEAEHQETLSLMEIVKFDLSYMYYYSERPGTLAARKYKDDVDLETKKRRLQEIIDQQFKYQIENNNNDVGKIFEVLVEKVSKKSEDEWCGRNEQSKMIIFPKGNFKMGDYVNVLIEKANKTTLKGVVVA